MRTCDLLLIVLFLFSGMTSSLGQDQLNRKIYDVLEGLQEDFPDVNLDQQLMEELLEIKEHPMNINSATKEDLIRLPFLTAQQIENLHYYIYQFGPMISIYELKGVEGYDMDLIQNMIPFVAINNDGTHRQEKNFKIMPQNELLVRTAGVLQETSGFEKKEALGSPLSYLLRNKLNYKNYTWILVSQKAIGESFFYGKKPEFISSSFQYKGSGLVRKVVVGDYKVHFGQGLIQSSSMFNRKSALIIPEPGNHNIRFSTSADGAWFKRGAAIHLSGNKLDAFAYASSKHVDATLYEDTVQGNTYFKSIRNGGLHRTNSEYRKRNAVCLTEYGGSIQYATASTKIACQGTYIEHDRLFLRNQNVFNNWWNLSLNAGGIKGEVHWWMEAAMDKHFSLSSIVGSDVYLDKTIGLSFVGRYYSPSYYSFFGNVFGEGGSASNETGLYIGMILNPFGTITIRSYVDVFQFPGPTYNTSTPSSGWEYLSQLEGQFDNEIEWLAKLKFEEKEVDTKNEPVSKFIKRRKYDGKVCLLYQVSGCSFKSLLQCSRFVLGREKENGWMFCQDVKRALLKDRMTFNGRVAFFYSPSYDTRLYAYEHDVLYAFTVPAYYGKGLRYAFNLSYKFNRKITFYAKYGYTLYSDRDMISTGFSEIKGNVKSDLKFQIRYRI